VTISVVLPAYNEAEFMGACLSSLRRQSRQADEIIVVDNNSSDATAAIARQYGARVVQEPRQGIMPAVYTGFSASSGDIIARCDADSVLPEDWLASIETALTDNPQAAAITGPGVFYGTSGFLAGAAQVWYMYAYFVLVGAALANWPLFGSNCAIRREVWLGIIDTVHRSRTDIHDDIDFSVHLRPHQRVLLNRNLKVGISARSLRPSGLGTRYARGLRSLLIHWPGSAPWERWRARLKVQR
jgi:glycosyltransferase involved in cell wall biosynthesis